MTSSEQAKSAHEPLAACRNLARRPVLLSCRAHHRGVKCCAQSPSAARECGSFKVGRRELPLEFTFPSRCCAVWRRCSSVLTVAS